MLQGDQTPEFTDCDTEDDAENLPPTGDLADLTASLREQMPTDEDLPPSSHQNYKGKGKGIGKGKSGSSGPPVKRRRIQASQPVSDEADQDTDVNESQTDPEKAVATQTITVGAKRGYSYYPAYLFDVPPKKLRMDHLRKKYLISEIARSNTQRCFYRNAMIFMSHFKEFMKSFATSRVTGCTNKKKNDHEYTIHDEDHDGDTAESEPDDD